MSRIGAAVWLAIIVMTAAYLLLRLASGITLQSSILALLPPTERDATAQNVQDRVATAFSRRVVFLIRHDDPTTARNAATQMTEALTRSGLFASITSRIDPAAQVRIAAAYFPYRNGLLTQSDRDQLLRNNGNALASRAMQAFYDLGGFANAKMIARDPFLLLPNYFLGLPLPQSRISSADGVLSVRDGGKTYVLVSADLAGDPYATRFQGQFVDFLAPVIVALQARAPGLTVLRTGAVFFAHDAAGEAMGEASLMGVISLVATLAMILLVFRGLRPILLGFVAIGNGVLCAFVGVLLIFGEVHTIVLLFGVSLIAISVDYSLQYFCEYFDPGAPDSAARLRRVLSGVTIGLFTTLIGYFTLLLAPFPGLRQVAVFSVIGLIASVLTVALWYPLLDSRRAPETGNRFVALSARHWQLWELPRFRLARIAILTGCVLLGLAGAFMLHADDDVRHLQSLSPDLKQQQAKIERLTGSSMGTQFLLVRGANEEALLQTEERIVPRLGALKAHGVLDNFTAMSEFVPSIERQKENRKLIETRLFAPQLKTYLAQLGYAGAIDTSNPDRFLRPSELPRSGPLSLLDLLRVSGEGRAAHIVLLQNVNNADAVRQAVTDMPEVRFVSLTDDWSRLFGEYRRYAIGLLVLSALLMYPIHAWRYGWINALRVMTPSILAVTLAAPLAALAGVAFTFFNAMALVLVLSIGVDYAIFCRETSGERKAVTMLAIALAALSTLLSFGMLALSNVFAVHAFGVTMLLGITVAFLLAPLAGDARFRGSESGIAMNLMPSAVLLASLVLAGCATVRQLPPNVSDQQALLAPGVACAIPMPDEHVKDVSVVQNIVVNIRGQTFSFQAQIQIGNGEVELVALDSLGRRGMTVNWREGKLEATRAAWLPQFVRPADILTDIAIVYWPAEAVAPALASCGATLTEAIGGRSLMSGTKELLTVEFDGGEGWNRTAQLHNGAFGFDINIQSAELR